MKNKVFENSSINNCSGENSESGFSMMELMIAMVIFLIITGSVYGLLQVGRVDRNRSSNRADIMKNARAALHLIGRDALNAGFGFHKSGAIVPDNLISTRLGVPPDTNNERDILTSVISGNDLFTNDLQTDPNERTDIISFAYRDLSFNGSNAIDLERAVSGSAPDITKVRTINVEARNANNFDLFLIESPISQIAVIATRVVNGRNIEFAPNDPLGLNQPFNGIGENRSLLRGCAENETDNCTNYTKATLKRITWVSYRVKQDGTLVRVRYGNNAGESAAEQIREQPLAYNVKALQFKYVLSNGTVTDDPVAGVDGIRGTIDDNPGNCNLIRQISISITIQSTELDEQTKLPQEIKLQSTFSARNLGYDEG